MSNISVTRFSLDVRQPRSQVTLHVGQYDTARTWKISLYDGGKPIDLTGLTPYISTVRLDGSKFQGLCSVENESEVVFRLSEYTNTAVAVGEHALQLELTDGDGHEVTTAEFTMVVTERVIPPDTFTATAEDMDIVQIAAANERQRQENESKRYWNEYLRERAEETRQTNESDRATAEKSRVDAEESRVESDLRRNIAVASVEGGHNVTITNGDGSTQVFFVPNGEKGDTGEKGEKGEKGDPCLSPPLLMIAHGGGALWKTVSADGSTRAWPRDSLSGVKTAIMRGFEYIEVDVNRTKDGYFIIYEGNDLVTTGAPISSLTLSQIRSAEKIATAWNGAGNIAETENIPLLEDILSLCVKYGVSPMLDIKSSACGHAAEILSLLSQYNLQDMSFINSYYHDELSAYKLLDPELSLIAYIPGSESLTQGTAEQLFKSLKTSVNRVFVGLSPKDLSEAQYGYVRNGGLDGIISYTIDSEDTLKQYLPYIVGFLTNGIYTHRDVVNGSIDCYTRPLNSGARGVRCYVNGGQGAFASGVDAEARGTASHSLGNGTLTSATGQLACGQWNAVDKEAIFICGCGTQDSTNARDTASRKNAFTVYPDGLKIGSTKITEAQLKKLIALI